MFALALGASNPALARQQGVVTDFLTGVAISGYDPVAYFTDTEPRRGSPEFEYHWQDVTWYFISAANRDAFASAPDVYAPRYGGHCAMSMARNYLTDGNPTIFVILEDQLLLFYSVGNREAFVTQPHINLSRANAQWDELPTPDAPLSAASGETQTPSQARN